ACSVRVNAAISSSTALAVELVAYTIGLHGVWTPENARKEARILLGRIANGDNPAEQRRFDVKAITVNELCERYLNDAESGLILGRGRRPKKASTLVIDKSRISRHIIPLLGTRRVKDVTHLPTLPVFSAT